jgi:MATE family multidrug resistance protein
VRRVDADVDSSFRITHARVFSIAVAPVLGALAYTYDGVFIGATWSRDMRNLMLVAYALYLGCWWALRG